MLSKKQVTDVCLHNQGCIACRYLEQDEYDWDKFYCIKLRSLEKAKIDKRLADKVSDMKRNGIDPKKQSIPIGDNCPGYPLLKSIEQGYDKD